MKRIPRNATFLGLTLDGESVYLAEDRFVAKKQGKPPYHTTIVVLLLELHGLSPAEYEEYREGRRQLREIFLDPRLAGYPLWRSLAYDRKYRFKPVGRYFTDADSLVAAHRGGDT